MKKIVLLLVAFCLYFHASAQDKLVKYQGEVVFGHAFGTGEIKNDKTNLQIINGIRIGKYFAVGIGLGLDCAGKSLWGFSTFGNLKGYLPVSNITSLFISTDIGGGWGNAHNLGTTNGIIVVPAIGTSFKVSPQSAINVSLAYTYQDIGKDPWTGLRSAYYNAWGIKVGFQF